MFFIADFGIQLPGKDSFRVGAQYGDAAIGPDTVLDSHGTQCADLR